MIYPELRKGAQKQLQAIEQADIVIGLPTHNVPPATAAHVAEQALTGAHSYFSDYRTTLIHADTGLPAKTRNAIRAIKHQQANVVTGRYIGTLGRGTAVAAILRGALTLNPKVIVILDSWTENISPTWLPALATLIVDNQADLVKPRYNVPLPDGAISDLLYYPFSRAVWGFTLQHAGTYDFALSPKLAQSVLQQDVWETEVNRYGFDIWLSTFAATEGWRLAQTALGLKRYQPKPHPATDVTQFVEAIGTMFRQMSIRGNWQEVKRITSPPTLTQFASKIDFPSTQNRDCADFIEALIMGWMAHRGFWQKIMRTENLTAIEQLASQKTDQIYFPSDLWAKIVYDFAVVYNKGEVDPDAVVASLYPLFLGRLASFWTEVAGLTVVGRAGTVSAQGVEFEENLPYLKHRWEDYIP